jgi:beta-lactamase class A
MCTTSELPEGDAQKLLAGIAAIAWDNRQNLEAVR